MKLLVIFASHRFGGENTKIEASMKSVEGNFEFDFVHLADNNIHSCMACLGCAETGRCVLPSTSDDKFQEIFDKMLLSDAIFIISPVYAGIPSRLTALFERMIAFFSFQDVSIQIIIHCLAKRQQFFHTRAAVFVMKLRLNSFLINSL